MKIHLVAVCGAGMGSLAGLLKAAGHDVSGSDQAFYPPMSERLRAWGIPTKQGFDPAHIGEDLDMVVVGNACRKGNPEVEQAITRGIRIASFPQLLSDMFIKGNRSIVVAGTHGKTTTVSLLSYLLTEAGMDPSYLVGGIPQNTGKSFRLGSGGLFVVEGDEYDSAFFDKQPKFLHYRPSVVILTSLEYDHADIYPDMQAYRSAFACLVSLLDEQASLVACFDDPEVRSLAQDACCRVISYGLHGDVDWRASDLEDGAHGTRFIVNTRDRSPGWVEIPLSGRHNVSNTLAVLAVVDILGLALESAGRQLGGFLGVARRMQIRGLVSGITVIDDFAHHPTEVSETILAVRKRYPKAQLVAVFEPRSNSSRRNIFQRRYEESFEHADRVVLVPPFNQDQIPLEERLDSESIVRALVREGKQAVLCLGVDQVVTKLTNELPSGAVVVIMSNGAFEDIHEKLLYALSQRGTGH